jgi:hypothetical protein
MKKRLKCAAFIISAIAGLTPAVAQSSYVVYNTIFYSDAAHTTQVGFLRGGCGRYGPQYTLTGSQSAYSEQVELGVCENGRLSPIE